jgi:hypothetical protein
MHLKVLISSDLRFRLIEVAFELMATHLRPADAWSQCPLEPQLAVMKEQKIQYRS